MQDFSEIEAIITKQRLMETLIVRHNALAVQLPKELTPDNADEFRLIKREIDGNMIRIQAIMAEIESDLARCSFTKENTEALLKRDVSSACPD